MYDLRIGSPEMPEIAIECVGAVDSTLTETWNIGPAKGPLNLPIAGDWTVVLGRNARVKSIRQRIAFLLQELQVRGIDNLHVDHRLKRVDMPLFDELESLGIEWAYCYSLEGTGKVHFTMSGRGGAVDDTGSSVPGWISDFLRDPTRADVLEKLGRSGARSCHVFVIVSLEGAPWPVESYLIGDHDKLPLQRPALPPPVNEVWVVHGLGQRGLRWDGEAWRWFNARGEGIEDESPN
jgi:hypothetical protein